MDASKQPLDLSRAAPPDVSPTLGKLEALFHQLVAIPKGADRDTTAARLSEGDPELARQALDLADADEGAAAASKTALAAGLQPRLYGHYRTVSLLGTGGMGAVYLAERADDQFRHVVAVKVIAPHAVGENFQERFRAERQILAGLNHPDIPKLLDGGVTGEGTPYVVMEFVDGAPLDAFCDTHKLNLRARLELFRKLCEPVAYAHRNLVVHRDLKPSNIMVTAEGRPKLLDFGTAKLLAEEQSYAATVAPLLTLRYSSPEQRIRVPVTTSTDIFSLGVILYEMVTGAWPFGDPSSPRDLLDRFGQNTAMTAPHEAVTESAAQTRSTNSAALRTSLSGDLSNILTKALSSEPERRYQTVQALSDDVGNWLSGLPVNARQATFACRAGKFLRRRWLPAVAASIFVLGLAGATLVAVRQARVARAEAQKSEKVNQFLNDMVGSAGELQFDPQTFTVAQMLDAAEPRIEKSWSNDAAIQATLRTSLATSYAALQRHEKATALFESARNAFHKLGNQAEEARIDVLLGQNTGLAGEPRRAAGYYRAALELEHRLGADVSALIVFQAKVGLADTLSAGLGEDLGQARKLFEEAIELGARDRTIPRTALANGMAQSAGLLLNAGDKAGAETLARQALDIFLREHYEGIYKAQPLYELMILNSRDRNYGAAAGFARQAYEVWLGSVGAGHEKTLEFKIMWARFRADNGEVNEAAASILEAMPALLGLLDRPLSGHHSPVLLMF